MTKTPLAAARRLAAASTLALAAAAVAGPACASAFYIQEQSVKGLGRAYSGEAADNGPDSLFWTPAAIAEMDLGLQTYMGLQAVNVQASVDDRGSTLTRGGVAEPVGGEPYASKPVLFGVVPNSAAAWRLNDRIAVGLAITAPFNFTSKYDQDSWVRYDASKSLLFSLDVQPTVAVHVTRWLDLGASFDAQYVDATLSNAIPNLSSDLPDGEQRLSGDGWDYGYTVGAQLRPTSRLSIGASYRSAISHTLSGSVTANAFAGNALLSALAALNTSGKASFTTPWIATVGARYRLTDRLTLNGQVQRVGWNEFNKIDVDFTLLGAATTQTMREDYRSTTSEAVGLDYEVNPQWTLRTGFQYDPTPTVNANRSARVPDGDRLIYGVGTTFHVNRRLSVDLAGGYVQFRESHVHVSETPLSGTPLAGAVGVVDLVGDISGQGEVLSAGVHYAF